MQHLLKQQVSCHKRVASRAADETDGCLVFCKTHAVNSTVGVCNGIVLKQLKRLPFHQGSLQTGIRTSA